ncbi:MAG: hypothetical protein ACJ8DI_12110 [Ktedonobacteraceae bacterium]
MWDARTGEERSTLRGHNHKVDACAVGPSGIYIISISWDDTMRLWSVETGRCLVTLHLEGSLQSCAFYPGGRHILAGRLSGLYFLRLML